MKYLTDGLITVFVIMALLVGCAKKEHAAKPKQPPPLGLEAYIVDASQYPQPQAGANEMVTCAYDGMKMRRSDVGASVIYKGKTLYFYTLDEMVEFMKKKGIFSPDKSHRK